MAPPVADGVLLCMAVGHPVDVSVRTRGNVGTAWSYNRLVGSLDDQEARMGKVGLADVFGDRHGGVYGTLVVG